MDDGLKTCKTLSHDYYLDLYDKWHSSLGAALSGCLESQDYIRMRTGLVILALLVDVFPTQPSVGVRLYDALKPLQDENSSRPDIRVSANACGKMLSKSRDEGKWVKEDEMEAKARADKEEAAFKARKKKLEQNFQEIERDSKNITAVIGSRDNRHDRRHDYNDPRDLRRLASQNNGRSGSYDCLEFGELNVRDRQRDDRRDRHLDDRGAAGGGVRGLGFAEDGGGGGGNAPPRDDRQWQLDAPSGRTNNNIRSRPPWLENDRGTKRPQAELDDFASRPPVADRGDFSPRRNRSRPSSPDPDNFSLRTRVAGGGRGE